MAVKESCPVCPAPFVWDRNSKFNSGCLMLTTALPFILVIAFLVFFLVNLYNR